MRLTSEQFAAWKRDGTLVAPGIRGIRHQELGVGLLRPCAARMAAPRASRGWMDSVS